MTLEQMARHAEREGRTPATALAGCYMLLFDMKDLTEEDKADIVCYINIWEKVNGVITHEKIRVWAAWCDAAIKATEGTP